MLRQCWSLSHYHLPFTKLKELDLSVRILESTVKRMFLYTYTSFWAHNKTVPTSIYLLILLSILDLGKGEKKKENLISNLSKPNFLFSVISATYLPLPRTMYFIVPTN
uniref:Uncharacterized protein n=1 Tax=Cacopsylla melanoneura TaxID=428564 RepID=A0A8D8QUR7_9HEMI